MNTLLKINELTNYYNFLFIFIFTTFDLIFGILKAIKNKNFKSSKMKNGLIEKSYIMLLFWVFIIFEQFAKMYKINMSIELFKVDLTISKFYAILTILNQITSILENINKTFPKILPSKIVDLFEETKENI